MRTTRDESMEASLIEEGRNTSFEVKSVRMLGREKIEHLAPEIVSSGAGIHKKMSRIHHSPFRGPTLDETRVTGGQRPKQAVGILSFP